MKNKKLLIFLFGGLCVPGIFSIPQAANLEIYPSTSTNCNEEFQSAANRLKPGDELISFSMAGFIPTPARGLSW